MVAIDPRHSNILFLTFTRFPAFELPIRVRYGLSDGMTQKSRVLKNVLNTRNGTFESAATVIQVTYDQPS